eukprot:SAG31_NODE_4656_length_3065_cov_13.806136_2_plen_208_part_00
MYQVSAQTFETALWPKHLAYKSSVLQCDASARGVTVLSGEDPPDVVFRHAIALVRPWAVSELGLLPASEADPLSLPRLAHPAQLRAFETDGFLILRQLFSPAEAAKWRARLLDACGQPPANWESIDDGTMRNAAPAVEQGRSAPAGSVGRLQWGTRFEPRAAGIDPSNPNGLLFVQGSNLIGDAWLGLAVDTRVVGVMCGLLRSQDM